jgi:hypothetical protein
MSATPHPTAPIAARGDVAGRSRRPRPWSPAVSATTVTRGALLPLTRAGTVVLFVLALANGVFLYLFPAQAIHYAWAIRPPASAAFLGAGFLAGTAPTALVVFATARWRSLRTLPPALFVLAVTLFVATILHAEKFRWGYPPTWGWVAVYALVPFGVAYLWLMQERSAEPEPPADPALRPLRGASAVLGAVLVAGAAALYLFPVGVGRHWPWTLTPLTAQAIAPWYAMIGVILLACARGLRRRSEALIPYSTLLPWSVLLLLIPVLQSEDVVRHGAPLVLYVVVAAAVLAVAVLGLVQSYAVARREGL